MKATANKVEVTWKLPLGGDSKIVSEAGAIKLAKKLYKEHKSSEVPLQVTFKAIANDSSK